MIRYGIIISIDDVLQVEASRRRMSKTDFTQHFLNDMLAGESEELQRKLRGEFITNPIEALYGVGITDWVRERLNPLIVEDIEGNKIFIGSTTSLHGLTPISVINQDVPNDQRNQVNMFLDRLGYGMYSPTIWLNLAVEKGEMLHSGYVSTGKL
jgi:hypothetical protein